MSSIIHNIVHLSTPHALYFGILWKVFLNRRKSLSVKDLGLAGYPRRPNPLRGKDLGQQHNNVRLSSPN